jgi:hypothetical protein
VTSGGGSGAYVSVHVGEDWWTHLCTYDDRTPILDIDAGSTSLSISIEGNDADRAAVEFARELARRVTAFAAEVERLHAHRGGQSCEGGEPGNGEAA